MIVLCDTREQKPHPWAALLPSGWGFERVTLESGDFALASHPHGAVVERKTPGDLASCIGAGRERFERELKRARYCGRIFVVVEGSLSDVTVAARGIHHNAVWVRSRRGRCATARLSSPEAGGWLRNLPGGFWPPSFLQASADGLSKPGERS